MSIHNFCIWPWTLTYELDLGSQASLGQGRPSYQISRSKVKQESWDKQTDPETHKWTDTTECIISQLRDASRSTIMMFLLWWIYFNSDKRWSNTSDRFYDPFRLWISWTTYIRVDRQNKIYSKFIILLSPTVDRWARQHNFFSEFSDSGKLPHPPGCWKPN